MIPERLRNLLLIWSLPHWFEVSSQAVQCPPRFMKVKDDGFMTNTMRIADLREKLPCGQLERLTMKFSEVSTWHRFQNFSNCLCHLRSIPGLQSYNSRPLQDRTDPWHQEVAWGTVGLIFYMVNLARHLSYHELWVFLKAEVQPLPQMHHVFFPLPKVPLHHGLEVVVGSRLKDWIGPQT